MVFEEFVPIIILKVGGYNFVKGKLCLHRSSSVIFDLSSLESIKKINNIKYIEFKKDKIEEEKTVQSKLQAPCFVYTNS